MKKLVIVVIALSLTACTNPIEPLITEENVRMTSKMFGNVFLESCDKNNTLEYHPPRCTKQIAEATANANKNGHTEIKVEHFTEKVVAKYIATGRPYYNDYRAFTSKSRNPFNLERYNESVRKMQGKQ